MSVDNDDFHNDETPEVNKGGRPPYEPNEYDEGLLTAFLSIGFPHAQIALYMKKNIRTLKKHYPELFETIMNTADKTAMVENGLWYNAVHKLNVVAQIAWLKAHRRELYSERAQQQDNSNDMNPNEFLKALSKNLPN